MEIILLINNKTFAESTPVSWEEWWTYDGISGKPDRLFSNRIFVINNISFSVI